MCATPENKDAVHSFLGMVGYLDNFTENYIAIAAALYQSMRRGNKFNWGKEEEEAFRRNKRASQMRRTWHSSTQVDPWHNPPYTSKFQGRLISRSASEDRQRHTTSTFYQSYDDGNKEKVQPN